MNFPRINRRHLLGSSLIGSWVGLIGASASTAFAASSPTPKSHSAHAAGNMTTVGDVDPASNGFDPHNILTEWDRGVTSIDSDGRTVREFLITAEDKEIEIAPGVFFPAWTYNGRVPGPTLRVTEGDRLRIVFRNNGSMPHTMHFHGIHGASMDGLTGAGEVEPGGEFTYRFDAYPFGCHLYHCHSIPLKRHIHKGLYGGFIIDPNPDLHPDLAPQAIAIARSRQHGTPENATWQEMIMVMNAFDTNYDDKNEVYAVNTVAHAYAKKPISIARDRPVRIYLINLTEFDQINSFHLHANFFDYHDHGTTLAPTSKTIDTVMLCQGQRGIVEFSFAGFEPGHYMFHAHQSEFAELGWMGNFEVTA